MVITTPRHVTDSSSLSPVYQLRGRQVAYLVCPYGRRKSSILKGQAAAAAAAATAPRLRGVQLPPRNVGESLPKLVRPFFRRAATTLAAEPAA